MEIKQILPGIAIGFLSVTIAPEVEINVVCAENTIELSNAKTISPRDVKLKEIKEVALNKQLVTKSEFINKITPVVQKQIEIAKSKGLKTPLPSVAIAQIVVETGYGKTPLAKKANNFLGLKLSSAMKKANKKKPGSYPYYEAYDDEVNRFGVKIKSKFMKFKTFDTCVSYYIERLNNPDIHCYQRGLNKNTPKEQITEIAKKYATDKNYAKAVLSVIKTHNLKELDS